MLSHMAQKYGLPVAYVNQVGGNDDLIFDGRSSVFDREGRWSLAPKAFRKTSWSWTWLWEIKCKVPAPCADDDFETEAEIWHALVLGVRDYVSKTRFSKVLLGLSGGIDSALTAAIAAEAVGPENVLGVLMPSRYSSGGSVDDSVELARNLGIQTLTLPISDIMQTYDGVLAEAFQGRASDVTEENIQSRIRGNLLMALSNKFGSLLLTTGNKSEISVGYCTLYGDMNGGLAVIADLPKMMVYRVSHWRNRVKPDIPESHSHQSALGGTASRSEQTRTACRPTICWIRFWSCISSSASRLKTSSPAGSMRRRSAGCCGWCASRNLKESRRRRC